MLEIRFELATLLK